MMKKEKMNKLVIDQENKFYKTWIKDLGWKIFYNFAIPRITKSNHVGCKWQKGEEKTFDKEPDAELFYQQILKQLEIDYQNKKIAQYLIRKNHFTTLHTHCPKCNEEADILTWIMIMGTEIYPQAPIVCKHCKSEGMNDIDNEVGIYYFKEMAFEHEDKEKYFQQINYVIKLEDLKEIK